ncbi:sodium/hydrogen exchanger 9 isoform X1 [Octopus sinensis]|uniref:Sodium/hydrogen exchanger n=1 Tax=Octopus sinensis TaxID=2607531 RepID=A0A6P7T5U9_9MOLL|nr:sodium/hydrogen exchanger 9 isoform X1 [Octopus sinensis]
MATLSNIILLRCSWHLVLHVVFWWFLLAVIPCSMANVPNESPSIEAQEEAYVTFRHKTDSLTILMLLTLLLLTILTIWLFKHRRFRFVHETGLSMIYGLVVGAVIRYAGGPSSHRVPPQAKLINATATVENIPNSIYLFLNISNSSHSETLQYNFYSKVKTETQGVPLERTVTFDPELFFNVLLPVIIFNAGYSMKRKHFFRNLGAVMTYALIGTTISSIVFGGIMYGLTRIMNISHLIQLTDCFFFGAVISATDPVTILAIFHDLNVDVDLYALVFGESVLNDAVAIVLSRAVEQYAHAAGGENQANAFFGSLGNFVGVFLGAFVIGAAIGCITALMTKYTKIREYPLLETALFFLMSYSTFQAAEAAGLTGIVAVLFCGITQAHYTYNNLSSESKARTKQLFELCNFLAENFVFLYIGVSVFTFQAMKWHAIFIFSAFFAIIIARFSNVYPLSYLLNLGRKNKISFAFQHMMMFAGLRGAIAFALAIRNTSTAARQYMVSAIMMVVLVTVIVCGSMTTPMLQWLKIRVGVDEEHEQPFEPVRTAINRQKQYSTMDGPASEQSSSSAAGGTPSNSTAAGVPNQTSTSPGSVPSEQPPSGEKAWLVLHWYNFDTKYMKPFLTNSRPLLTETLPTWCLPIAKLLTTNEQLSEGLHKRESDSDTDMIIDHSESYGENTSVASGHTADMIDRKPTLQINLEDDATSGDLGLGESNHHQLSLRINLPGSHDNNPYKTLPD